MIGVVGHDGLDNPVHNKFIDLFVDMTSKEACDEPLKEADGESWAPICFVGNGNSATDGMDDFAMNAADGALALAFVTHRLSNGGAPFKHQLAPSIDTVTAANVYTGLLNLGTFDGVSGTGIGLDPNTGDRQGNVWLYNIQAIQSDAWITPKLVHVATFDSRNARLERSKWFRFVDTPTIFPGNTTAVPFHGDSKTFRVIELGALCEFVAGPAREKCDHVLAAVQVGASGKLTCIMRPYD